MKKRKLMFLAGATVLLCAVVTAVYFLLFVVSKDTKAPEITIVGDVLEVSVKADEASLLQGLTAVDNRDGDVTDQILIEGISSISEDDTVTITYAAFDSSNNVSKASRTLKYTDYEPPVFGLTETLVLRDNGTKDVLGYVSAFDTIDGNISNKVKATLVSDTSSLSNAGMHQVEFRVTNSLGDTQYITLPVEVRSDNIHNASVDLGGNYLIYLKRGETFKPEKYLENLIVGDMEYSLENQNPPVTNLSKEEIEALGEDRELDVRTYINRYVDPDENEDPFVAIVNVEIENNVKTTVPGIYSVIYTVDYEERYIGYARLNVVVEE